VNDVANWLMVYIVNSAWQIPLLAAFMAALLKIVARADGKLQYHLWVGCLAICIALPVLSAMNPLPQLTVYPSELNAVPTQSETKQVVEAESPILTYAAKVTQPVREERLGQFLLCFYALSLLVGIVRFLWKLKLTRDIVIRASRITLSASASNSLLRATTALGIAPVGVYSSPGVRCPAAARWPRPMLIVPADFSLVPENDAIAAIAHELAHIRRHDFEVNLAYEVLSLFAFYHPAMHWIKRRIADSREVLCDAIAADVTTGRTAYAKSLLNFAKTVSKPATQNLLLGVLSRTTLEKRITKLIDVPLPSTRAYRSLSAACCWMILTASSVGALTLSIRFPAAQARNEDAQIPRFDAVLVKPNRTDAGHVTVEFPEEGDRVTIKNIPLQWLIENAYDMPFENRRLIRSTGLDQMGSIRHSGQDR
jgi:beta-lactamase regulating signal transducer with metallopeptidase domain